MNECPFKKPTKEIYSEECQDPNKHVIVAHTLGGYAKIKKPSPRRKWMDGTKLTNGCLPLVSANELGWVILSPFDFLASWDGSNNSKGIKIACENPKHKDFVMSHFGFGVLTFRVGYLFETTVGHGLYVKGPANSHKPFIYPLEGLVETDWLTFPFSMNWKFTDSKKEVFFQEGEPVCQIFPYPRDYVNKFEPMKKPLEGKMKEFLQLYSKSRMQHNQKLKTSEEIMEVKDMLQKTYLTGRYHDGTKCQDLGFKHEPKCGAKDFPE
jgi:hypothetical protein